MKKTVTALMSSSSLLLMTESALAHSGHAHTLFHAHDNATLMTASIALVLSAGAFIGYKLMTVKRPTAKRATAKHRKH